MATQQFKNAWLDGFNLELERLNSQSEVRYQSKRIKWLISEITRRKATSKAEIRAILREFEEKADIYEKSIVSSYLASGITDVIQNSVTNETRLLLDRNPLTTAMNVYNASVGVVDNRLPEPMETIAVYLLAKGFSSFKQQAKKNIAENQKMFDDNLINDLRGDIRTATDTGKEIADYLDRKWIKKKVEQPYNWTDARVRRLVETQAHANLELAKQFDAEDKGYKLKMWVTQRDSKVRTSHNKVNGMTVGLEERFRLDRGLARFPSDPDLPPSEKMNCRCFLVYK